MTTAIRSRCVSARPIGAAALLAALLAAASPVAAQAPPPAPATGGLNTAPIGRMRLSFSLVPAPLGSYTTNFLGVDVSSDTAFAFGIRPVFDYSINEYFFVGFGPQLTFNVKGDDAGDAGKALDLLARVGGHAPVADNIHLFGYLAPGYSILFPPGDSQSDEKAKGFALGVAAGAIYSFPGNFFAVADIGYQLGFQKVTFGNASVDSKFNYLLIGLGAGVKL